MPRNWRVSALAVSAVGGGRLLAVLLDGELRGMKLFLKLQVAAQRLLRIRFLAFGRACRRRGGLGPKGSDR